MQGIEDIVYANTSLNTSYISWLHHRKVTVSVWRICYLDHKITCSMQSHADCRANLFLWSTKSYIISRKYENHWQVKWVTIILSYAIFCREALEFTIPIDAILTRTNHLNVTVVRARPLHCSATPGWKQTAATTKMIRSGSGSIKKSPGCRHGLQTPQISAQLSVYRISATRLIHKILPAQPTRPKWSPTNIPVSDTTAAISAPTGQSCFGNMWETNSIKQVVLIMHKHLPQCLKPALWFFFLKQISHFATITFTHVCTLSGNNTSYAVQAGN